MEVIIVINAGSSSIKFQALERKSYKVLASGLLERLYIDGVFNMKVGNNKISSKADFPNHEKATEYLIEKLIQHNVLKNISDLKGIGHRVVQGGAIFKKATKLSKQDIEKINKLSALAPLHNPGAVAAMKAFSKFAPKAINVADFDTAFHQTIPSYNNTYAIPNEWTTKYFVKRYGAHGISYEYITQEMAKFLKKKVNKVNLIVAHLGNGASIAAIKNGQSYNTSMGLTPLAGLIMGTRSGDIDPSILNYINVQTKMSIQDITNILNKESGLKALTGSADMRDVTEQVAEGNPKTTLGLKIWACQVANYISMYYNQLEGKIDGLVFTAGIGENSAIARQAIMKEISILQGNISISLNKKDYDKIKTISDSKSMNKIYVLRTNEELLIAQKVEKELNK